MHRAAAIFTVLVLTALAAGILAARGKAPRGDDFVHAPASAPDLPPLVDPLAAPPGGPRADRLVVRVVGSDGKPVDGAALVVRSGASLVWAFSDAQGSATLDGLAPEPAQLAVIAFPHPGLEVEVRPAAEVREVVLPPAVEPPARFADIARSDFSGTLIAPGLESEAGYEVLLLPVAAPSELGGALPRSAVCDAESRFRFEGLAHGRYLLKVLPAWAAGGTWPDLAAPGERELDFQGGAEPRVIELARGRIEGEVRDDRNRALAGALVLVSDAAGEGRIWPPSSTGPDGRFRIVDVPPGRYRVECRAGEGGSTLESLAVEAGAVAWASVPSFAARKRP